MQLPICETCVRSDILCAGCSKRLESGKITPNDLALSKFILKLSEKVKSLKDVFIKGTVATESIMVIITNKESMPCLIGKNGTVIKAIGKHFGKNIKIIYDTKNINELASILLSPLSVVGINIVYRQEGETYKINVWNPTKKNIQGQEDLEKIFFMLTGKHVQVNVVC